MKRLMLAAAIICILAGNTQAQEPDRLQDLKRPRYSVTIPRKQTEQTTDINVPPKRETVDNSRFTGTFKGRVTVHYENRMVSTDATLTIGSGESDRESHYDYYILPATGDYLETVWQLEGNEVNRSITISGSTVYVTDLIDYGNGGNSQIRTLVFSPDGSALTFLKTEFDDAKGSPATGQIIGRFIRVDQP